jgi:hypothetical protein
MLSRPVGTAAIRVDKVYQRIADLVWDISSLTHPVQFVACVDPRNKAFQYGHNRHRLGRIRSVVADVTNGLITVWHVPIGRWRWCLYDVNWIVGCVAACRSVTGNQLTAFFVALGGLVGRICHVDKELVASRTI